jgi:hypothetical protein
MRRSVLFLALLGLAAGCSAPAGPTYEEFDQPNSLLRTEIQRRVDQIPYQRGNALWLNCLWIAGRGEQVIPQLLVALQGENPKIRSHAAWILGRIGDTRTVEYVKKYLSDSHPVVRMEVAAALLNMGCDEGVPQLIQGLTSESQWNRYHCHQALQSWSGMEFGYDHQEEDRVVRQQGVRRWMDWWNEKSGKEVFPHRAQTGAYAVPPAGSGTE